MPSSELPNDDIPTFVWCEIPRDTFLPSNVIGSKVEYLYKITQYPITYAQYTAFIKDNGYTNNEYWSDAGKKWRKSLRGPLRPRGWHDPNWHFNDHPVVGITWYEALAFSKWLNKTLTFELAGNWEIRLPTEAEWEKAACYPDGRRYPWGNTFEEGYSNTFEANRIGRPYLHRTTPVNQYPRGVNPLGIYDLIGNVWEWCLSKWSDKYSYPENNNTEGKELRVIRGCSYDTPLNLVSTKYRQYNFPYEWSYDIGFRLVAIPQLSARNHEDKE